MTQGRTLEALLPRRETIRVPPSRQPSLLVVVDTEEEFDWSGAFDRSATSVSAMGEIGQAQAVCEEFGIRPTYLVDYPVASQVSGYGPLRDYAEEGTATIGAHLHPWVNPPYEEDLSSENSFPGNLPRQLEEQKLRRLMETVEEAFGQVPTLYKAGRYGLGANTASILSSLGFEIDLSSNPTFDFSPEGGPDFSDLTCEPYWFGDRSRLLGIPCTSAFIGPLRKTGRAMYRWERTPVQTTAKVLSVLSRTRLLDRLHLSPEGYDIEQLRRLTSDLLRRGARFFVFSFHSPSLKVGCTPYVTNNAELRSFLDCFRRYFDFFFAEVGGSTVTPHEVKTLAEQFSGGPLQ